MASNLFVESLESRMLLSANIVVQAQGLVIPNGNAVTTRADFTDFGPMSVSSGAATRRFVIKNTGDAPLSLSTLRINGVNRADFRITKAPTGDIAPGAKANVVVSFDPLARGVRGATVVISSNDPSIPNNTFAIKGKGLNTVTLPDGLQYTTTVPGTGPAAMPGNGLKVDYTGFLLNGVVFDSSLNPGRSPFFFQIIDTTDPSKMHVIQGWNEGMQGMRVGEHRTLFIPANLAYGPAGSGPIPANAPLVFEVTLLAYPTLNVLGPAQAPIPSGSPVRASLGTQFGTTTNGHSVSRTFLLQTDDSQNAALGLYTVNFSGTQSGQFAYSVANYDNTLGGWPVTITYKGTKVGTADVTVSIPNSNPYYPNYTFNIHAQTTA